MKKWILPLIFVGMIGWVLYDTLKENETETGVEPSTPEVTRETNQEEEESVDGDELSPDLGQEAPPKEGSAGELAIGITLGQEAPDFELQLLSGETASLSDFRGEKVMINFWASWCGPCRAEMPDMQKVFTNHDVQILAVNLTKTEPSQQAVEDFVDDFSLTFPILLDENIVVADLYQIQPIPTSFFVDTGGIIQSISYGPLNQDMILQRFNEMN